MLDVSQYTGERKRRDIEMVEFWKEDREVLRKAALIYDPSQTMDQLEKEIGIQSNSPVKKPQLKEEQSDMGF